MRLVLLLLLITGGSFFSGLNGQNVDADSLFNIADEYYDNANYEKAAHEFTKAGQAFLQQGDSVNWINSKLGKGDALLNTGNVSQALDLLLPLAEQPPTNVSNDVLARIYYFIGWSYRELEQYEESKTHYLQGIEFARASNDSLLIGRLNNNISYPYLYTGDYYTALDYQKKAMGIYDSLGLKTSLSNVMNGTFLVLTELGLHRQAQHYIRQSLALREEIGNPSMLDISYHNMAVNYEEMGQPDSAIIYYHKSLELSRQLQNPFEITQTLINIGRLYESSGDYDNALAYFNEALETNYQTERPVSIANNLMNLAHVALKNNDTENAATFYQEALTWLGETNSPQTLSTIYLDLADLEITRDNFPDAQDYIDEARKLIDDKEFLFQSARAHTLLGKLHQAKGNFLKSLAEYRKVYGMYSDQNYTSQIEPAINLARAYFLSNSDSAFYYADEAFALIDSGRTNVAGLSFRSGFYREYAGFYNEVASWYITKKNTPEKAFELVEAAKARVLMDELAEAQENVYATLDESTLIKKQQKAKQIDRLYHQIKQAQTEEQAQALKRDLTDLEFEYHSFLNEIHSGNQQLKNFKYPQPVALDQVQDLLDSETAILEYTFTKTGLIQLVITPKNITATYIDSVGNIDARTFFTEKVRSFRTSITEGAEIVEIQEKGLALYNKLIPSSLGSKSDKPSKIVIIPDGPLSFLPFEALSNNSGYMIEEHLIKYLPSSSIYPFIQSPHRNTTQGLLALAGSGFESEQNITSPTRSQASFASLPSTLLEVESISTNFDSATILKNEDVTEASLKSYDLSNFQFLHFATHANVDEINPSRSGLLLSKKADVESLFGEDGHLNSREISNLRLNADLVTLSACNTGMGPLVTGEGLIGLQRSFISAGASSVMVSLWSVFDRSTSEFMSTFYQRLLTHRENEYGMWNQTMDRFGLYKHPMIDYKTKAIRDAKLSLINHPYYNHPVHWAPFILIGK